MADATLGVAVLRTRLDASGLKTGLNQARSETQAATRGMSTNIQQLTKGLVAAGGALFAARGLINGARTLAGEAERAANATLIFNKQVARSQVDSREAAAMVDRLASRFGVLPQTVQEAVTLLLRAGGTLEDAERLLTAAGASAAAVGFDIGTAFDNAATAVATGRSELLETSGIVANLGPVTQAYAKSLGKTVEELTEEEVVRARVNAIYAESKAEIEDVDQLLSGLVGTEARVRTEAAELRQEFGQRFLPIVKAVGDGIAGALRWFNDLPQPIQTAVTGLSAFFASGATLLTTAAGLKVALTALGPAFAGLRAAMLPFLGPAGILFLVAGGVIALSEALSHPGGRSFEQSLEDAKIAVGNFESALADAKGDMSDTRVIETLNDSFTNLGENLTGPVKRAFEGMRDELLLTVQDAENASAALTRIIIGGNLAQDLQAGGLLNAPLIAGFRQAGALMFGEDRIIGADLDVQAALLRGDLEEALRIAREVERVLQRAPQSGVIEGISEFVTHLEGVINRLEQPVSTNVNVGVTAPTPLETGSGYDSLGIPEDDSTREVEVALSDPAAAARRWVERLEAELRFGLKGPREVIDLLSPRVEELREEAANALAEFGIDSEAYQDTVAKLDVVEGALDRIAGKSTVSLSLEPTAEVAEARPLGITPTAQVDTTGLRSVADIERDLAAARAAVRAAGTAEARAEAQALVLFLEDELRRATRGVSLAIQPVAQVLGEARELAIEPKAGLPAARPLGITPEAVVGDFTTIELLEDQLAEARRAVRTAASDEARHEAQLLVMDLERELERLKRQVTPRALGIEPTVTLNGPLRLSLDAGKVDGVMLFGAAGRGSGGRFGEANIIRQEDADRLREAAEAQRQAGFDFAEAVIGAGQGFVSAIEAFQAGNVGGGIAGLGGAVGGLFTAFGGLSGPISALGPWGALISAGAGLLGGIINLFSGGGQSDRERAEREQRRVGNVPAINLNFTVNQTNTYNGAPSQPENEQAFRRQANTLWEELYRRHLGPRLDRIEQRLGIAGA